jgi:rhamnose transport system permease protein
MSVMVQDAAPQVDFGRPLTRALLRPELPALAFIAVMVTVFAATAHGFFTTANLQQILAQVAIIGIIALGVNQVVLAGEIDVSVGSALAICAWAAGSVAVDHGGLLLPLVTAVGLGAAIGLVNGFLVVKARIPSIIVTLAMLTALRGGELVFNSIGIAGVPSSSRALGNGSVLGVDAAVVVLLVAVVVVGLLMRHTAWGREVPAVGGNRRAARQAGLPIDAIRWATFLLTGLCVGLAAIVYVGQVAAVQSNAATGLELEVLAAVVIGGTSITGGRGSVAAALVGAVLIGTMLNGMNLLGIVERWQNVFTGGVILLAVASDVVRRRMLRRFVVS